MPPLNHRKSGSKLSKSVIYDILNNPIYYGDFYWKKILYNGTHDPIISKELFDKVQKALDKRSSCPTGRQTRDFIFQGMLTCGRCGAIVAEIHKGKNEQISPPKRLRRHLWKSLALVI